MARLIDDLCRYGFANPRKDPKPEGSSIEEADYLPWTRLDHRKLLTGAIVIEVDDVARMIPADNGEGASLTAARFPCVVPPFDTCFVEFKIGYTNPGLFRHAGLLVLRLPDRERAALAIKFIDRGGSLEMGDAAQWEWDDHGLLLPPFRHMAPWEGCDLEAQEGEFLSNEYWVMLTAFSLLSCKNVKLRDALVPVALNKAHIKRCGLPLVRYKVLDVLPMRQAMKAAGDPQQRATVIKALHICRGHFKDYREHGLFGKAKEIFWWQPHVRGDVSSGVVVKDYSVKR